MPNIVIFQILLPLVSPFIDLMFLLGALSYVTSTSTRRPQIRPP